MSAAGICLCFAGIALLPKNGAQASTCLLQAPAYALQASRSCGKIGRRHLTPFGVLKIQKKGGVGAKASPTQLQYASKVALYARPVAKRGQGADVMVEGKTLLVLLLLGRCQHPAAAHSQPRRVMLLVARCAFRHRWNHLEPHRNHMI